MAKQRALSDLNEDCELLIRKEVEKFLVNYVQTDETKRGPLEISEITSQINMESPETRQLHLSPRQTLVMKERGPKMLPSSSAVIQYPMIENKIPKRRSFMRETGKKFVDAPIQATDEKYVVPRSTVLSRTRQHLSKRNSGAQSAEVKYKTMKIQTDNCAKHSIAVTAEPMDFIGMNEKGTNIPSSGQPGVSREQGTQMYNHITQSELYCIEWIHKYLFEVNLSPQTFVIDDKIRDLSETPCIL